jgi:hypothetical protein
MTARMWLSIIGAPIIGGAVYAWLTLSSQWPAIVPAHASLASLIVSGALVLLVFELAVAVPLLVIFRSHDQTRPLPFLIVASGAWLALCFLSFLSLGVGASAAFSNSTAIFLPGATLVLAFWFLGARSGA